MDLGHRCGYVGVPSDMQIDKDKISCHGGITYESNYLALQEDTDRCWIGFDTAHCFDMPDFETAKEYFKDNSDFMKYIIRREKFHKCGITVGEIRTLDYCIEECKRIVEQVLGDYEYLV